MVWLDGWYIVWYKQQKYILYDAYNDKFGWKNIIFVYVYDKRKKWQKSIFIIIIFMCYKNSIFLWVGSGKTFRRLVSIIFIAKDFILFILYNFHINLFPFFCYLHLAIHLVKLFLWLLFGNGVLWAYYFYTLLE